MARYGLNRITSYYHADNEGSRKLTERVGFEVEGRMRQAWFSGGLYADMVVVRDSASSAC